jgi:hypothetical protein
MNSVICDIYNSVKMSSFLLWSQRVHPAALLRKKKIHNIKRQDVQVQSKSASFKRVIAESRKNRTQTVATPAVQ